MRWWFLLVLVVIIGAACSDGGPSGPDVDATPEATAALPEGTTTLRPPTPTDPPERADPTFADLVIPCRPTPSTEIPPRPGVEADAVMIGTGSDRGGIGSPGAGNGIIEMVEVLVDLCNANGGITGRDIRVVEYDAAGSEAADRVEEACTEVVALVGQQFVQQLETAFSAAACGLPLFTGGTDLVPTSPFGLHGQLDAFFLEPSTAGSVVLVGPATPLAASDRNARRSAIDSTGGLLTVVGELAYPVDSVPDWDRIVGESRALGGGQIHIDGGCAQAVLPFVEVAELAAWRPVIVATAAAYDPACLATPQPDRLVVELPFLPFEDGDDAPAAAAHAALLDQIGADRTGVGVLAATEFWRWASAADECLAVEDPQCFTEARQAQDDWTGGGLHQAISSDGSSPGCAVVLGVEEGGFVRRLPVEPGTYDCAPERSVRLPPE